MFIQYSGIQLNIETIINNESSHDSVLFIHGFTGSSKDWMPIIPSLDKRFNYYLIDLVGHGKSDSPVEISLYSIDSITDQIKEIILTTNSNKLILAGYSLGGRIALNFAVKFGNMLSGLILESCSPGISDDNLREERIMQDEKLAEFIENNTIEKFIDYWMNIPLFNTQRRFSNEMLGRIREQKLQNNRTGLANSLRGSGTGRMDPLVDNLKDISLKALLLTGELDSKFTDINSDMVNYIRNAQHLIIKNAGHNTHLEEPQRFIDSVNNFLHVI
jgi:2-succinyl-6-hydroxy-2,4-cyclohexadiene-1-carboxylate synthase